MDDNNFDVRDACGKVLALVKQVWILCVPSHILLNNFI
jgi:hypothetical protein